MKNPENDIRFRGADDKTNPNWVITFFYPDFNRRLWNSPHSLCFVGALSPYPALFVALVGYTTDRELHPAPKVKHSIRKDYTAILPSEKTLLEMLLEI
jgi:hypothetical protein